MNGVTTRYVCPVRRCAWAFDEEVALPESACPHSSLKELMAAIFSARREHLRHTEDTLREHLESAHGTVGLVREVVELRGELDQEYTASRDALSRLKRIDWLHYEADTGECGECGPYSGWPCATKRRATGAVE